MSNIEKMEVQFGSKGPEIHPAGDTGGDMVIADINPDEVLTPEHAETVAYQMAAAPDLLTACKSARQWIAEVLRERAKNHGCNCDADIRLFAEVREAIAKAKQN